LVGINLKFIPFNQAAFYGQLAIDELDFTKLGSGGHIDQRLGWQLGFKVFNPFGLKKLYAQVEYNAVRPYTYAHESSLEMFGWRIRQIPAWIEKRSEITISSEGALARAHIPIVHEFIYVSHRSKTSTSDREMTNEVFSQ